MKLHIKLPKFVSIREDGRETVDFRAPLRIPAMASVQP